MTGLERSWYVEQGTEWILWTEPDTTNIHAFEVVLAAGSRFLRWRLGGGIQAGSCDDGDACTSASACTETSCVGTTTISCDDSNVCTTDGCNPGSGCVNTLSVICDDTNPCTADVCDAILGCIAPPVADGTACPDAGECLEGVCRDCVNDGGCPEGMHCDPNFTCGP